MVENKRSLDKDLTARFIDGDRDAFKLVFRTYYAPLCLFGSKILGNTMEVEDLVMDVFVQILQKNERLQHIRDLSSFLYTSVKNSCIDFLRKQKKQLLIEGLTDLGEFSINDVFEAEAAYAQLLSKVYEEIELLPPQCRLIFKRLFMDGQTTQQIADELKLSVQSVRNQKTRAIDILKLKIDPNLLFIVLIQFATKHIHIN